jgi:glycosyltransferase involved in cell wall biosynthesis
MVNVNVMNDPAPRVNSEVSSKVEPIKISIVVPNYNGGATLGMTLKSLIDQNYPNLEIIVVDGGSTDDSLAVIQSFSPHIAAWMSEKDEGQSHAINKGFAKCSGEVVNWLCSDDYLLPNALHTVGAYFANHPEVDVIAGQCRVLFEPKSRLGLPLQGAGFWMSLLGRLIPACSRFIEPDPENKDAYITAPTLDHIALLPINCPIAQSSCFYRRKLLNRPQPLQQSYEYAMDWELWAYFSASQAHWAVLDDILSVAVMSGDNKTSVAGVKATYELERIYTTYVQEWVPLTFWHRHFRYPIEHFLHQHRSRLWIYLLGPAWLLLTLMLAPFYGLVRVWSLRWSTF